jgi:hypothetical protein
MPNCGLALPCSQTATSNGPLLAITNSDVTSGDVEQLVGGSLAEVVHIALVPPVAQPTAAAIWISTCSGSWPASSDHSLCL